jgi:hypothetical protein
MKKIISLSSFTSVLLALFLFSCSKESPVTSKQNVSAVSKIVADNNSARVNPGSLGTISGVLSPLPLKASLTAYNDHYVSEETTMNQDGTFKLNNLPPDGYILHINYVSANSPDYLSFEFYKIIVTGGQNTNVGVITLPE